MVEARDQCRADVRAAPGLPLLRVTWISAISSFSRSDVGTWWRYIYIFNESTALGLRLRGVHLATHMHVYASTQQRRGHLDGGKVGQVVTRAADGRGAAAVELCGRAAFGAPRRCVLIVVAALHGVEAAGLPLPHRVDQLQVARLADAARVEAGLGCKRLQTRNRNQNRRLSVWPHGRTAASRWTLCGSAAHAECFAQP